MVVELTTQNLIGTAAVLFAYLAWVRTTNIRANTRREALRDEIGDLPWVGSETNYRFEPIRFSVREVWWYRFLKYLIPFVPFKGTTKIEFLFGEGHLPTADAFEDVGIEMPEDITIRNTTEGTVIVEFDTASIQILDRKISTFDDKVENFHKKIY